ASLVDAAWFHRLQMQPGRAIAHRDAQLVLERLADDLDDAGVHAAGALDGVRARFRDGELDVFDLVDRKPQPARDGAGGPPYGDPLGTPGYLQLDRAVRRHFQRVGGRVHTSAFMALCSSSKIPKIFTRPVMSKIFLICGLVHTRLTEPPCSRTRLSPPISTPRPVESM